MQPPGRNFQRKAVRSHNVHATLVQPGFPDRSCTVSDISDGGARIELEGDAPIPARFMLALDHDHRWVCEPIWWHGKTVGLRFVR
jgi:hypothetical protein